MMHFACVFLGHNVSDRQIQREAVLPVRCFSQGFASALHPSTG